MFNRMKQHGFTLIELLLTLIILAVLAAYALVKFTNLTSEARIASVESIASALSSTSTLFHLKANIQGVTDGAVEIEGNSVVIDNGYVSGHWSNAWRYALNIGL